VSYWAGRSGLAVSQLLSWLGLPTGKYHAWQARRGLPNRHNAPVPKAQWLLPWERCYASDGIGISLVGL